MAVKSLKTSSLKSAPVATNSMLAGYDGSDYELVQTVILGANTPSVTFDVSTLSGKYKHLEIRIVTKGGTASNGNVHGRFNGDTGANYSFHSLWGNGSSVGSEGSGGNTFLPQFGSLQPNGSQFGCAIVSILDPFSTTKFKTTRGMHGCVEGAFVAIRNTSGAWRSLNAVTSVTVFGDYDMALGSRFSLYGIKG